MSRSDNRSNRALRVWDLESAKNSGSGLPGNEKQLHRRGALLSLIVLRPSGRYDSEAFSV